MKYKLNLHIILVLAFGMLFMTSCKRYVIILDSVPENTPKDQPIYVTGNFNNWDPGEEKYIMTLGPDSNYYLTLPPGFGTVEYKFTRGDWTTVEKDICGDEVGNRLIILPKTDSITNTIESWNDLDPINCPKLTILLDNIPYNTPVEDFITIASKFNSWDPDNASIFEKNNYGDYSLTINRPPGVSKLEYKITRGDLSKSESDEFGNEIQNRILEFGKKDTVRLNIQSWSDLPDTRSKRVVIIVDGLPKNTPKYDDIFLVSNLNSWNTSDMNYKFQLNRNGQLFYPVPRKNETLDFKITRGDWHTVEVDKNGWDIENRSINLQNTDTVYINIEQWKDIGMYGNDEITIILDKIPSSTPDNAKFYVFGNFNGWNPGKLRHMFHKNTEGNYYVNLPRKLGNIEMKVTRGSLRNSQVKNDGSDMPFYSSNYNDFDTLFVNVENWKDIPKKHVNKVTLVIDRVPIRTPDSDYIFLAPDFNGWNPEDKKLIFDKLPDGRYAITIPAKGKSMDYKITRGGWSTAEVDSYGDEVPNRTLYYGFADTVYIKVKKWRDLGGNY
ncbi:MAG: hypothetical protein QM503_01380 [Bacteroidota bacterium]